jgi:hypothetical protein
LWHHSPNGTRVSLNIQHTECVIILFSTFQV